MLLVINSCISDFRCFFKPLKSITFLILVSFLCSDSSLNSFSKKSNDRRSNKVAVNFIFIIIHIAQVNFIKLKILKNPERKK